MNLDAELPSLFSDLELGEVLDAALPVSDSGGVQPLPAFLGLDLRDLPAPVGPRPRSPLSLRSTVSGVSMESRRSAGAARAPASASMPAPRPLGLPDGEPAPLPAPPPRGPLAELVNSAPMPVMAMSALAAAGEGKGALRPELAGSGFPVDELAGPPPGKRVSNPAMTVSALAGPPAAKRVSSPALAVPPPAGPPAAKRASSPALAVPLLGVPPGSKRASSPALAIPPSAGPPGGQRGSNSGTVLPLPRELIDRGLQPLPRRSSQPGLAMLNKPVHALFDASEPPPQSTPLSRAADSEPAAVPLPALPSDESGNARQAAGSDSSGLSVITGPPAGSSTVTAEPRPVRLGYLIAGLAVLAILLAVIIAHIAGAWHKHGLPSLDKADPTKPPAAAAPEPGPY